MSNDPNENVDLIPPTEGGKALLIELGIQEQSWFWSRFAAFSALHAALFIILRSAAIDSAIYICLFGLVLASLWAYIQLKSRWYVHRYKEAFVALRTQLGVAPRRKSVWSQLMSSTTAGAIVPVLIVVAWMFLTYVTLYSQGDLQPQSAAAGVQSRANDNKASPTTREAADQK